MARLVDAKSAAIPAELRLSINAYYASARVPTQTAVEGRKKDVKRRVTLLP